MSSFDISIAESGLNTACIGRKIIHRSVTVTTMNDAEHGARQGDPHGTVYIADMMTGGRGTKGRNWVAESNGNLYMSFVLHIQLPKDEDPFTNRCREYDIDVAGALATLQALQEIGLEEVKIKWLNDLWVKGHKILGALTEYKGKITVESREAHLYVLGIGLNVNCDMHRDQEMHPVATSVLCVLGNSISREVIFAKICNHLEPLLEKDRGDLLKLYSLHEAVKCGNKVKAYMQNNSILDGTFKKVNDDWSAEIIEDHSNKPVSFQCTEVSLRPVRTKVVYVLNGPDIHSWSSECLLRTCNSLVDTQIFEVKFLSTDMVSLDILSPCVLVVIGQLTSILSRTPNYVSIIGEYVENGGACLVIGSACSLFKTNDVVGINDQNPTQDQEHIPHVIETFVSSFPTPKQCVFLCLFQDNCHFFPKYHETSIILARRPSKMDGDIKYSKNLHSCDLCISNSKDVAVVNIGKGKLCFCRANIEISYADIPELFPRLQDKSESLKENVHHRDRLFQDILTNLLK